MLPMRRVPTILTLATLVVCFAVACKRPQRDGETSSTSQPNACPADFRLVGTERFAVGNVEYDCTQLATFAEERVARACVVKLGTMGSDGRNCLCRFTSGPDPSEAMISVTLPPPSTDVAPSPTPCTFAIQIGADAHATVDGAPATPADLARLVAAKCPNDPTTRAIIASNPAVPQATLIAWIDALRELGILRFAIATPSAGAVRP